MPVLSYIYNILRNCNENNLMKLQRDNNQRDNNQRDNNIKHQRK